MHLKIPISKLCITTKTQFSAQIVASIDDLLIEIFLRLPLKSIFRFKSVSKHWNSLISDPGLGILRNPGPNPASGFFYRQGLYEYEYVPFPRTKSTIPPYKQLKFINDSTDILRSCSGLLLCTGDCGGRRTYHVYNPTTDKFSTIPKVDELGFNGICLAFDPARSPHYKVFCIRWAWDHFYQFEVYSSESHRWRKSGEPFEMRPYCFRHVVYWNGAIHWIDNASSNDALCFHIDDEILLEMPTLPAPDRHVYWGCWNRLWESCDHLHYMIKAEGPHEPMDVYEMRRDYSEWFLKYSVDVSALSSAYGETIDSFNIFSLVRGVKEEDSFLCVMISGKMIGYNINNQTFETICEFRGSIFDRTRVFEYIESLCCV